MAASAGIQFGDLQTEAFRLREKLGPDHEKAYYEIIRQLARGGAVSESEQRVLLELGKRGFAGIAARARSHWRSSARLRTMPFLPILAEAAALSQGRRSIRSVTFCWVLLVAHSAVSG